FKARRFADQRFGASDILHARKLDNHAIASLTRDRGLMHAKLGNTVTDDFDTLVDRLVADIAHVVARQSELKHAGLLTHDAEGPVFFLDQIVDVFALSRIVIQDVVAIIDRQTVNERTRSFYSHPL